MRIGLSILMLLSQVGWACGRGWPVVFNVPGSSYSGEKLYMQQHREGTGIRTGDDVIFYDGAKKKWCIEDTTVKDKAKRDSCGFAKVELTDSKTQKKIGIIEFDDSKRQFFMFSINSKGEKDSAKPYVKFLETLKLPDGPTRKSDEDPYAILNFEGEMVGGESPGRLVSERGGHLKSSGVFVPMAYRSAAPPEPKEERVVELGGHEITMGKCGAPSIQASGSKGTGGDDDDVAK